MQPTLRWSPTRGQRSFGASCGRSSFLPEAIALALDLRILLRQLLRLPDLVTWCCARLPDARKRTAPTCLRCSGSRGGSRSSLQLLRWDKKRDASSVLTLPSPLCSKAAHRQGKPPMPEIYTQKSHQLQLRSRGFPCVSQMLCKWVAGCSAVRLPTRCRLALLVVMFPRMLIQLQCDPEAELNKLTKPVSGPTTVRWKWLPRC